jgi:uncharacterized protein YndB with AHSA1/START domain
MAASSARPDSAAPSEIFSISRTFKAPRSLVWDAFTKPEHLKHWWGPKGFLPATAKMDLRVGGMFLYDLRSPNGQSIWGRWIFREIVAPERFVCVSSFSDEKGGLTRHPMAPEWPLETLSTTTFADKNGGTTVTVRWEPINATARELEIFAAGRESMNGGWTGTLDKLEAYLERT